MLMVLVAPGLLAFVFGWFAFRSRVTGVYLSIITQAMTYALMLAFFRNDMGFGGNNGLTDFKDILGFDIKAASTRTALFVASCVALAAGYLVCRFIIASKLGKVLVAVRDAESRTRFLGYRVENYKLFVFIVSACMAGVAGALYVPQVGIINPSEFSPANSIEVVIWVAVGGRGTLVGRRSARSSSTSPRRPSPARLPDYLALRARRHVRPRHAVPAEGHRRHARASTGAAGRDGTAAAAPAPTAASKARRSRAT